MGLSHEVVPSSSDGVQFVSPDIETATTATASPEAIPAEGLATTRDSGVAGLLPPAEMETVATGSSALAGEALRLPVRFPCEGTARASPATTIGGGNVNSKPLVYLAEDLDAGTTYSDAQDSGRIVDSRSSVVNRSERACRVRNSCGSCVLSETLRKLLCEGELVKDPGSDGGRCKGEVKCNMVSSGSTPAHTKRSKSESSCDTDGVDLYYSNKGRKRRDSLFLASAGAEGVAADKTASAPLSVTNLQVVQLDNRCEASDAPRERSHMGINVKLQADEETWRQVLQPQMAHQRQQEHEQVQLREQRDWLQTQECLRQQQAVGQQPQERRDARQEPQLKVHVLLQQPLNDKKATDGSNEESGAEEQKQLCSNPPQRVSLGTSGPHWVISSCGQAGQVKALNNLQEEQAALVSSAEKLGGVDGITLLQPEKCYSSSSSPEVHLSTHTPFVLQFPQPGGSAVAAHCYRGQPNDKLPPVPHSLHRAIEVGSAPFAAASFPHPQVTSDVSQCADVALRRGSTSPPPVATLQNFPAGTYTHWKPVCLSAGRHGTAAVSVPDGCSCPVTSPALNNAWQRTSRTDEHTYCANEGASADVHSLPVNSETHLAAAMSDSASVPLLATSFCEHPVGSATPGSSAREFLDSLHQQRVPHLVQREHQLPQDRIYKEEQEQLQSPQSLRMLQQQARRLNTGSGWAQPDRLSGSLENQWSSPICLSSLRADSTADEGETKRKWLTAVPAWLVATVGEDEAGAEDPEDAGSRREVRHVSADSILSASCSSESAAVSICLFGEEEQRAHVERDGTRFLGRGLLLYSQSQEALLEERFTQQQMQGLGRQQRQVGRGLLLHSQSQEALLEERFTQQQMQGLGRQQRQVELPRFSQHGGLQQLQHEALAGPVQQEVQQQDSGGSYSYVEQRVKSADNRESLPVEAHSSSGSDAFVVDEKGLHSWISDAVENKYTAASAVPCSLMQPNLDEEGGKGDRTSCVGPLTPASVVDSRTETCTAETWCYSPCPSAYVRSTACASSVTPVLTTVSGASRGYQAGYISGLPCSRFVVQPHAGCERTAVNFQTVLPYPMRLLRSVGVVGAPPSAVAGAGASREMKTSGGDRETAREGQSTSPRRIGRSHSVLKRAASADPASGRFGRVKTVSFANLNECENSMVGRSTMTSKGIDPTSIGGAASTSLPLCISSSNSDTLLPREIGKGSVDNEMRRSAGKGETATTAAKGGPVGVQGEIGKAEVTLEMQRVDMGKAKRKAGGAAASAGRQEGAAGASQGRPREESSAEATERKTKPSKGRFRTTLTAAVGWLRGGGRENAPVAAAERGPGRRQDAEGGSGIYSSRDRSSSSSLLSEDTLMRREGDVASAGRDRGEVQSSSRSSGGEESGADSSEGDREEGGRRRKKRAANRRRGRRSSDSLRGHRGSNRDRRTSGYRAQRIGRGSRSARASPSSESLVDKASTRLTQMFRNFFRAVQNLTEHDTVFRMQDELSTRGSRLPPRGAAPGSEVTGGGSSVSSAPVAGAAGALGSRSSPRSGTGGTAGTGLRQGYSAAESITGAAAGGGVTRGGIAAESSLSRSGSSDALLRRLPLKFVDGDLEDLFAGNINKWMTARLLLMGLLMLVVTSLMWPLMAWSFNLQDAFNHSEPIGVLFHVDMSLNVIVSILFIVTRFSNTLTDHAELIGDAGTFVVITIWGIWNTIASFILESSYVRDVIRPQTIGGHQGYVSLEKTTSWSSAQEASSAVAYLYGLLLIVQLDVVYPSRTRRTWQIHLMFFLLSSSSIIVRGAINPNFVPVPFVVIRVATYLMLTIFLYVGRHATELQQRQTFYNWLMTRKRVDRLESDLKRQKESGKVSTAVEQLVDLIKQCKETFQSLEAGLPDATPFHRTQLDECNRTMDRCLSILTNTTNLYTVQFGELDSDTHRDIIQAFLNTHNSSPADWARMTRGAFSRVEGGPYTPTLSQAARQPSGRPGVFDQGITLDELTSRGVPSETATQRRSTSSHVSSEVGYSPLSSKGHADEAQLANALLRRASSAGLGGVSVSAGASSVPPSTPTGVDASPGRTTAEESKISPREPHGDALFDFTYTSPRGREFSDEEPVFVQSTSKRARHLEEQGALAPGASEGGSEKGESVLRTAAVPELQGGAQRDRRGKFAHLLPRAAVAARDVALRRKWSHGLPMTSPAGKEAARGGTAIAPAPGYESPRSGVLEEIPGKRVDGRKPRESRTAVADRDASADSTLARELVRLGETGGGAFPAEAQPSGAGVVDRAEGRRLSSAVAPDEVKDETAGATLGVGVAQQKDVLTRITPSPTDGRRPSATAAGVASWRKGAVAGALVYRAFVMDHRARREMRARNEAVARVLSLPTGSPQLNFVPRLSEEEVLTWDFDCLLHAKESPAPLMDVGYALLSRPCENLLLPNKEVLVRFLKAVEAQYNAVPYHNSIHGCMVTQKMIALTHLMQLTNKVSNRDLAVMIVAGLCHDLGHPGRNNALLINAIDPVAVLYNDKSVLENYHSCLTFKTLDLPDCDIFWVLRSKLRREYHVMRSLIIELILATDMKNHFETVSRFRIRRLAADFDISGEEDLWFLLKIVIKCADLSHCGVNWSQHFEWCLRLCTEFYDQGDEELARHLPVSPLCEREKHAEVAKAQLGFMNFVTIPLYEELVAVDTTGSVECYCISYMKANVRNWELTASAGVRVPLYGKELTSDVQSPFSQLLDQNQHPSPKPGSKAAEIASRYAHVTLTCVDLTPLVMRTQLSRSQRDSQLLSDRSSDVPTKRGAT